MRTAAVKASRHADRQPKRFTWNALLWALIYPQRTHRTIPTLPGAMLVSLSFGIGLAAYNSSSNILFLTLSLLLTSFILSGVLSSLNFRGVKWMLEAPHALRVGHDAILELDVRNRKTLLPSYGLMFSFVARPRAAPEQLRPETTLTARGADIRAALERADAEEARGRVGLPDRLDPSGRAKVEWIFKPIRRGRLRIELVSVGSLFPFGFLRKEIGSGDSVDAVVWPAPTAYVRHAPIAAARRSGEERTTRAGAGNDLLAVRRYHMGDSHRLIHWKASARTRQLLVRQFSAEVAEGCLVWINSDAALWPRPEQFELFVSFAATLSEDLFRAGRLQGVVVNEEEAVTVRRIHELERMLDRLAVLEPHAASVSDPLQGRSNVLTFSAEGTRGVAAVLEGQVVASA